MLGERRSGFVLKRAFRTQDFEHRAHCQMSLVIQAATQSLFRKHVIL
jgi:hypothetical protein